jgi:hypothetical protein
MVLIVYVVSFIQNYFSGEYLLKGSRKRQLSEDQEDHRKHLWVLLTHQNHDDSEQVLLSSAEPSATSSPAISPKSLRRSRRSIQEKDSGWMPWTEILREKYPALKPKQEFVQFFKLFQQENSVDDYQIPRTNTSIFGWLPHQYHQQFIDEFEEEFEDMSELAETHSPSDSNASTPKIDKKKVDKVESMKQTIVWKDVIRERVPTFKFDSTTEKRIRTGIGIFLTEHCDSVGFDAKVLMPTGNSNRHFLIPLVLVDKFISWFKEEQKTDFRSFDAKRRSNGANSSEQISKRQKVDHESEIESVRVPNLTVDMSKRPDLKLLHYKEYKIFM